MAIICRGGQELRGQFGTGPDARLLEDVPDMSLYSVFRHEHRCGDLFVGPALGDQRGDALLGAGEPVRSGRMMILSSSLRALLAYRGAPRCSKMESAWPSDARAAGFWIARRSIMPFLQGGCVPARMASAAWSWYDSARSEAALAPWRSPSAAARCARQRAPVARAQGRLSAFPRASNWRVNDQAYLSSPSAARALNLVREELHQAHARPPQINLAERRIAENKSSADSRTSTRSPPDSFAATRWSKLHARSVFKPHTLIVENY